MAFGTNIYGSYDFGFAAGEKNREDLLDIIVNIAPWDTPLFSSMPKTTTRHTTHEWIEDSLGTASTKSEGAAFSADTLLVRERKSNWTMIFGKHIAVTETQRAVNPAGIKDEYSYQVGIAMKEIARGIETAIFASTAATGTSNTNRVMKALESFITTNTASGADGTLKSILDSLIEKAYIAGGTPNRVFCHPNTKSKFAANLGVQSGGTMVNYRNIAASDARINGNVDVYVSNFGVVEFVPDRFIPTAAASSGYGRYWLLEQPKIRMAFLRPIKHVPLPPDGDRTRGMILGEMTMEVMAESAHAKCINVTAG